MSSFVRKLMATGAALSIGISSLAVANDYFGPQNGSYGYNGGYNGGYSACNPCPPPCAPVCDPCGNWCDNLSFNAAWLYWKASGDDFQYAVDKVRTAGPVTGVFASEEKFHDVSFDWDSGFRIGVYGHLPRAGWDLGVEWTEFHTSSKSNTTILADPTATVTVTAGFPALDGFSTADLTGTESAAFAARVKFHYDTVDIDMGKWFCCGDGSLMFKPHVGIRVVDIQERLKYDAVSSGELFNDAYAAAEFRHKNTFKGAGVRVGLATDLHLCEGWSFIGCGSASAIWGNTHLRNRLTLATTALAGSEVAQIREDYRQTRFITDLSLGIRWKTMACGCFPLTIDLAWEHHYLFNQHRYWVDDNYDSPETTSSWRSTGDMALQGLTLTAGFDF